MAEIGYATLGIIPSFDGFERNLTHGTSGTMSKVGGASGTQFGEAAGKTAGSRFGSVFKSAAKAGLVGIGVLAVGAFKLAKDSIGAASDLEESTNKVQQVFGKGAESVFKFSEKAADALGQTNQQARDAAATFGLFGNIAGLSDKKSAKFATRMTTLASDLASFHNTEPSEAVEALGAALRGESEPIRSYGVLLDEATLKAEALKMGLLEPVKDKAKIQGYQVAILEGQKAYNDAVDEFGPKSLEALKAEAALGTARDRLKTATEGTIPPLTQQQKVLAAQSAIFKQTEVAQGDFARTSDGLANQQRRLSARFEDAKAKLGTGLLPIMTDAADFLLDKGIPAFEKFSDWFNDEGIPGIKNFADDMEPAVGFAKDLVGYINDLPKEVKIGGLGALAAVLGSAKLRGGSGLLGSAGSALGLTKPMPVFVTNAGFGATSGATGALGAGAAGTEKGKTPIAAAKGGSRMTLARGAVYITAAYFAADAITKILGWEEEGPKQARRREKFDKKQNVGPDTLTLDEKARERLADMFKIDGTGLFGLMRDDKGLSNALVNQDPTRLLEVQKMLRKEYGLSFKSLEKQGYLIDGTADALAGLLRPARETAGVFKTFPKDLKTEIMLNGADRSLADARGLVKQYDLTPKQKSTLFEVLGIDHNKQTMKTYTGVLRDAGQPVKTPVSLTGVPRAHAQIDGLMDALADFAGAASAAIDAAGDVALGRGRGGSRLRDVGRDRQRRRNLGGTP